MPAILDDPTAPAIYRTSGTAPFPLPNGPLPVDVIPRLVTLRDRVTVATLVPFSSPTQVPIKLMAHLCALLNREIEQGDTYPMIEPMPLSSFGPYWFANFGAVMFMGTVQSVEEVAQKEAQGVDWSKECLGSFYIKPNYPGRSSHVCNGGFLVTNAARNRGVGRLMGECYLDWAPKLGYTYSVFNLVYETNDASLRIWDGLGFKRIGRVKGCGNLKSHPDRFIDAIIFGRDLGGENDDDVSEERFDKIRYYLKNGTYPNGSDRAEKSRLRSAATHYRLVASTDPVDNGEEKLMLKGKEVIADPQKQYEIALSTHTQGQHGGINKTTACIAEKYHWVRIKETVTAAIKNCPECKESVGSPAFMAARRSASQTTANGGTTSVFTASRGILTTGSPQSQQPQSGAGASPAPPISHQQQQSNNASPMTYPPYPDVPLDPQIATIHHWETPSHFQGQQGDAMQIDRNPLSTSGLDGQHLTSSGLNRQHQDVVPVQGDISARLREELEAEIMSQDEAYARELRQRGPSN